MQQRCTHEVTPAHLTISARRVDFGKDKKYTLFSGAVHRVVLPTGAQRSGGTCFSWRALTLLGTLLLLAGRVSAAQLCTTTHTSDLYCLIPATFHTAATPFNALFTPFGTELGELPLARAAVSVPVFRNNVLASTNATNGLGTVFSEQAESLPRHHIFAGLTYQNFTFGRLDNNSLKDIPIVLYAPDQQTYTVTHSRFDIRVGQYTALLAAGITDWLDVSAALPLENISFAARVTGTEYGVGASAAFNEFVPGHASGLGDLQLGAKASVLHRSNVLVGTGVDVRLPTGDELNFLGSGALGVRPYAAITLATRVSPHLNVGYQWNGKTILNASALGDKQTLPTDLFYNVGAEYTPNKNFTVVADLLGKHFYNAPRLSAPITSTYTSQLTAASVQPYVGSYTSNDLSIGIKSDRLREGRLIITGNATVALNGAGLRARVVPLGGISYAF